VPRPRSLLPAFNTTKGIAQQRFSVHDKDVASYTGWVGSTCLAEIASLSMEFTAVSHVTGESPQHRR
jgi:hypothetical protein